MPAPADANKQWIYIATIEYGVTVCVTKLWILWVYRRAFSARTIFNALATILVVVLVGFYSSVTLVQIFECTPREKIFNSTVPGRCVNRDVLFDIVDSFNTITDFLVLSLPTREAWELEGSKTKKVLVVCLFTFGIW